MYTIRGIRGLGAGAFTGESFAMDNRLAQSQVASNPIARAALANDGAAVTFEDRSGQIAQARAEAEAAADARRAQDDAAGGGGSAYDMSTGTKVAIGVGVGIAVLALFSLLK
jgi:hypothetical protein